MERARTPAHNSSGLHLSTKHAPAAVQRGDVVQAGASYGRVRSCVGSRGEEIVATPSTAVSVLGLDSVPAAGDTFRVFLSETEAREAADVRPMIPCSLCTWYIINFQNSLWLPHQRNASHVQQGCC